MKLTMFPDAGERQVCFVGDRLELALSLEGGLDFPAGGQAFLRTTIGAGGIQDDEIIRAFENGTVPSHAAWYDIELKHRGRRFEITLELPEPGFFRAKPYFVDAAGHQHWPLGDDFGVSVHPNRYRTANSIYCAWPRLFGETKELASAIDPDQEATFQSWDEAGYHVIPPSGTLRDLGKELDHIVGRLGCRIVHLLPVNPTPTTMARFGRYGSPYASTDLTAVDPALVQFDQRTTGIEQFREFARQVHRRGAAVFIDLVINHTGWGSRLYELYPEWFRRHEDGRFASPGAWGTVWEDLVELEHHDPKLGEELAEVFLTWCRRGVDGFRCDAGYMVPLPIWRYITARVRREFPDTVFLLEGLGGAWEVTEQLLTEGGMQWAYSELFQNYSGDQISWYTDYALQQSQRMGVYVHYSETHDNSRLAAKGAVWSRLRNYLCGLTSVSGAFGFTCGVEWLAAEKIIVHQRTGLNWGQEPNLVDELARLIRLLGSHPCFFDGVKLERISESDAPVFALVRQSADGDDRVLVLINSDAEMAQQITLEKTAYDGLSALKVDLLEQTVPKRKRLFNGSYQFELAPGAAYCLAASKSPKGADGDVYRSQMAIRSWIIETAHSISPKALFAGIDWTELIPHVQSDPVRFLVILRHAIRRGLIAELPKLLAAESAEMPFPQIVVWEKGDHERIVPVPENHWFLVRSDSPCEVKLSFSDCPNCLQRRSTRLSEATHVVCFDVRSDWNGRARIEVATLGEHEGLLQGEIDFLAAEPVVLEKTTIRRAEGGEDLEAPVVLLTNGRGGMSRLAVDFGEIKSKYDCLLGANLHSTVPVDRHVLAKRARLWANAGGLITGLREENLLSFEPGPPAVWRYLICGGRGRWIPLEVSIDLLPDKNTVAIKCRRLPAESIDSRDVAILYGQSNAARAKKIPASEIDEVPVSLTLRVDIEDRGFHSETVLNPGSEHHFETHTSVISGKPGFRFQPAHDRLLEVIASGGDYFDGVEWSSGLSHPVEASRGQTGSGDAYSPGWFEVDLNDDRPVLFVVNGEREAINWKEIEASFAKREQMMAERVRLAELKDGDYFGAQLVKAASAFVVRRDAGMSVIAGYPWFLDWGRDSLICARGLLTCGYQEEVLQLLRVYGQYEKDGTLPNSIHGENTSNRDTSDAPLWFGMVCADFVERLGPDVLQTPVAGSGDEEAGSGAPLTKTLGDVLQQIALGYLRGTPNGIRVDGESGLVWSPSHFTWMDTNHPPGTPREGYPVEIQVMWILLLRLLDRVGIPSSDASWAEHADKALASFENYFWVEHKACYADLIIAGEGQPASAGVVDTAIRSNFPLAISTGLVRGERAWRSIQVALRYLIVPGGVRSLAALPADVPHSVYGNGGQLLNDPHHPYWGRYEGDEDTRRKPAYHNGTVWGWPLGILCEAVLEAWEYSDEAKAAVRSYLMASERLLRRGCIGQLPEIMDGDAPHTQRGCDAQAWSVTEVLRIWKKIS